MDLTLMLLDRYAAKAEIAGVSHEHHPNSPRDQNILKLIDDALKKANKSLKDVQNIKINYDKGSFTGIKVAVSVANALAFARGITVNGQKPPLLPQYPREPNITMKKESKQ